MVRRTDGSVGPRPWPIEIWNLDKNLRKNDPKTTPKRKKTLKKIQKRSETIWKLSETICKRSETVGRRSSKLRTSPLRRLEEEIRVSIHSFMSTFQYKLPLAFGDTIGDFDLQVGTANCQLTIVAMAPCQSVAGHFQKFAAATMMPSDIARQSCHKAR